jgi:hypothetical protein
MNDMSKEELDKVHEELYKTIGFIALKKRRADMTYAFEGIIPHLRRREEERTEDADFEIIEPLALPGTNAHNESLTALTNLLKSSEDELTD